MRRFEIIGTRCSEMPPCERSGSLEPRQVVPSARWCRARRCVRRRRRGRRCGRPAARSARRPRFARQHQFDARQLAQPASDVARTAPRRQVDGRERAERAVMHDVGIGDRQDDARRARRRASRRAAPAGRRRSGVPSRVGLGVHAVVGGQRRPPRRARRARPDSRRSSRRSRWRLGVPGAALCWT